MRTKPLLALALVVLALGAYLLWVEPHTQSTDERRKAAKAMFALEPEAIEAVAIERGGETLRLVHHPAADSPRKDTSSDASAADLNALPVAAGDEPASEQASGDSSFWQLEAPRVARADRAMVEGLVRDLTGLAKERTFIDLDRAAAGLEAPRAQVTLTTAKGDLRLVIGPDVPGTSSMLVAVAGRDEIDQVPNRLWQTLIQPAGDWRDKTLLRAARQTIEAVTLKSATGDVRLVRHGDHFWLEYPLQDRANESRVGELLGQLDPLSAQRFVDAEQETAHADGSGGTLAVHLSTRSEPVVITFGQRATGQRATGQQATGQQATGQQASAAGTGQRYARIGEQVVVVGSRLAELTASPAATWRDPHWTARQVFSLKAATFTDREGTLELTRSDTQWRRDGEPIDYAAASELLYAVTDVQSETFVDVEAGDKADDREEPSAEGALGIRLVAEGQDGAETIERLTLEPQPDASLLARSSERPGSALKLEAGSDQPLRQRLDAVRQAPVATSNDGDPATTP